MNGWEKTLSIDKLRIIGRVLVNSCYCCLKDEEICNHLLLWCLTTYSLWCMVYGLLGHLEERNGRTFDENSINRLKDGWIHYFGSIC